MPEDAWMCLLKQDTEYALGPKIPTPKFWIWQSSENGRVLNMRALHSILNMPEYAVNVSCSSSLYLVLNISWVLNMPGFWIRQGSEYEGVTHGSNYATLWLNIIWIECEYAWICLNVC